MLFFYLIFCHFERYCSVCTAVIFTLTAVFFFAIYFTIFNFALS